MHRISRFALRSLPAAAAGCFLLAGASAQQNELVGSWDCSFSFEDPEVNMSADYEHVFSADGESTLEGVFRISVPSIEFSDSFSLKRTATWRMESMTLFETTLDVEIASTAESPSPVSQLMAQQLQGMFANGAAEQEDSSPIRTLNATTLELDEEGDTISCKRA